MLNKKNYFFLSFCIYSIWCITTFLFSFKYTEPFPAVILPSFSSTPKNNNSFKLIDYKTILFYSNGDSISICHKELFNKFPEQYVIPILKNLVDNKTPYNRKRTINLGDWQIQISRLKRIPSPADSTEFKLFIRERIQEITKRKNYTYLKIVCSEKLYNPEFPNQFEACKINEKTFFLN